MKKIKYFVLAAVSALLVGCGGHGYEGEYSIEFKDAMFGKKHSGNGATMILGSDFMELEGERTQFDSIEVVNDRLVLTKEGSAPESLDIVDESTITMNTGFGVMTFTKI